jgi:membrane associated rhomboid family serine protease
MFFFVAGVIFLGLGLFALYAGGMKLVVGALIFIVLGGISIWYGRRIRLGGGLSDAPPAERLEEQKFVHHLNTEHWQVPAALILSNVLVFFLLNMRTGHTMGNLSLETMLSWGAGLGGLIAHGQPWRLFTSMFLHADIFHLLGNMGALYFAGRYISYSLGHTRTIGIYLVGGLMGSIAQIIFSPGIVFLGASGAVFALEGALFGLMVASSKGYGEKMPLTQATKIFIGMHILKSLSAGFGVAGIGNAAHVAGFLTGMACAMLIAHFEPDENQTYGGMIGAPLLTFFICQFTVFTSLPSAQQAVARIRVLSSLQKIARLGAKYQGSINRIQAVSQKVQNGQLNEAEFHQTMAKVVPEIQGIYRDMYSIKAANQDVHALQTALYYHIGYMLMALDMMEKGQTGSPNHTRTLASAGNYGDQAGSLMGQLSAKYIGPQ